MSSRKFSRWTAGTLLGVLLAATAAAAPPPDPKFKYEAVPPPKPDVEAEKKLAAKGGMLLQGGNSKVLTGTLGVLGSYQAASNRFAAEGNIAYARSGFIVDRNANMLLDPEEVDDAQARTTSQLFSGKARYDRFLTLNNSAYGSAQVLSDVPSGKELVAGGQVGYSRQLYKSDRARSVAELGYDFAVERAVAAGAELVQVHSARAFVGHELKLSDDTGVLGNVEVLTNLNRESAPAPGYPEVATFEDTRLNAKLGLTTTLWKNVAFGFSFGARYDHAPAPLKPPLGLALAPMFLPVAKRLDTTTEATLLITFL